MASSVLARITSRLGRCSVSAVAPCSVSRACRVGCTASQTTRMPTKCAVRRSASRTYRCSTSTAYEKRIAGNTAAVSLLSRASVKGTTDHPTWPATNKERARQDETQHPEVLAPRDPQQRRSPQGQARDAERRDHRDPPGCEAARQCGEHRQVGDPQQSAERSERRFVQPPTLKRPEMHLSRPRAIPTEIRVSERPQVGEARVARLVEKDVVVAEEWALERDPVGDNREEGKHERQRE